MIRPVQINNIKVWLYIQKLSAYSTNQLSKDLMETEEYLCYLNLSPPSGTSFGELIRDDQKRPKLFVSPEEAEMYAFKHLGSKLNIQFKGRILQ
jgi:hypothetical protein